LPPAVQKLPSHLQDVWMSAFNSAWEEYKHDEAKAFAVAWAAVNRLRNKQGELSAEDFAFLQGKLSETDLNVDNVWETHDKSFERMNTYFDEYSKQRQAHPDLSAAEIWDLVTEVFKPKQASVFHYLAQLHSPFEYQGKYYAKIRVIDTTTSRPSAPKGERWRPTYEGLKRALKSLLHMPLVSTPEEGHAGTDLQGVPVSYSMPDGYADVTFEINNPEAWKGIKSGEWIHVSPEVVATKQHKEGDVAVLDDFTFQRVAFVDKGAFPNATVQQIWEADMIHKLGAELDLDSHTETGAPAGEFDLNRIATAAATRISRQAADQIEKTKEVFQMADKPVDNPPSEQATKDKMQVYEEENKRLQAELANEKQARALAEMNQPLNKQYQAEHERLKKEVADLREKDAQRTAETHMAAVKEVVDLRIEAGYADANDRANEILRVKELNPAAIEMQRSDLTAFLLNAESSGPKAQFVASKSSDLETVVRQRLGVQKLKETK